MREREGRHLLPLLPALRPQVPGRRLAAAFPAQRRLRQHLRSGRPDPALRCHEPAPPLKDGRGPRSAAPSARPPPGRLLAARRHRQARWVAARPAPGGRCRRCCLEQGRGQGCAGQSCAGGNFVGPPGSASPCHSHLPARAGLAGVVAARLGLGLGCALLYGA